MPNGRPGDHPLTDIFVHDLNVYGKEADDYIRKIRRLSSSRELDEWWTKEINLNCEKAEVLVKAKQRYQELLQRAKTSGWEVNNEGTEPVTEGGLAKKQG